MSVEEEIEGFRTFEYEKGGCLKTVLKEKRQQKKRSSKKERDANTTQVQIIGSVNGS